MTNRWSRVPVFPLLMVPLTLGITAVETSIARTESRAEFAEAELFLELNDTAGDLGIHSSIDGGPWTHLEIQGPTGREMLEITSTGRLQSHGLTQLFFESAEPSFDELDPADFFRRFPEGPYKIEGRLMEGGTLESTAMLSHVLAAPPDNLRVNGAAAAESCDEPPPTVISPVTIRWDPSPDRILRSERKARSR